LGWIPAALSAPKLASLAQCGCDANAMERNSGEPISERSLNVLKNYLSREKIWFAVGIRTGARSAANLSSGKPQRQGRLYLKNHKAAAVAIAKRNF
jgi:hypothetical protein